MVAVGMLVTAFMVGAVIGAGIVLIDLYPKYTKLVSDNAQLREKFKACHANGSLAIARANNTRALALSLLGR